MWPSDLARIVVRVDQVPDGRDAHTTDWGEIVDHFRPHPSLSTRLPTSLAFVAASAGPPQLVPAAAADPPRLGRRGPPRLRHLACHASTPPSPVRHLAFSSASSRRSSANGPSLASLLISPCESEEGVSPIHEFQQALNLQAHPYSRCSVLLHPFMVRVCLLEFSEKKIEPIHGAM